MYRYIDLAKITAAGLAAAVLLSIPSRIAQGTEAMKNCLFFPQFTAAAAADRNVPTDGEDITYSFRIIELLERLWKQS